MPTAPAAPATPLLFPASPGWDDARKAWDLAVDQHPAAIALPESAADVIAAVSFACRHGLRIAAQGTGHNAAPLGPLADTVLVKTHRMRRVSIDPHTRTARAEAGAVWADVVGPAAGHGLAALAGSSPDVGVVGYTIGGGMGWLGRAYGLSASNVEAFEAVTADGRLVRADACTEPDLFWALRGGGGSFAVVTAAELRLFPVTEVYAGLLWWPIGAGGEVLHAWQELTASGLPDEFTTTFRFLRFPDVADVPEPVRGRAFAVVDAIHLGTPAEGDALLAPLRKLRPVTDTVAPISMPALSHLHMDPEHPVPGVGDGIMLATLPPEAVTRLLDAAGPGTGSPLGVELRHVGGEMKRARPGNGALAAVDADYSLFAVSAAPTPQAVSAIGHEVAAVLSAMSPWAAAQTYLNLTETRRDPAGFWTSQAYDRLRRVKAAVDPADLIRANHPIPPADPAQAAALVQGHGILQPAG
jgi:FAD binding domain/Berberine and berberine like